MVLEKLFWFNFICFKNLNCKENTNYILNINIYMARFSLPPLERFEMHGATGPTFKFNNLPTANCSPPPHFQSVPPPPQFLRR